MNMWAVSGMPVYEVEPRPTRPKTSKGSKVFKKSRFPGLQSPTRDTAPPLVRPVTSSDAGPHDARSIDQLLDPAVDGPPSPESIRELSKQMKRASVREKHLSHQTSSSGSSSLRSLTSVDRPSWDNAFEGRSLSRKSSGRSTSSSMPSRDRPESVQIFGKTIFNRRGKLRRESSAQSSSASSSLYSNDTVADASLPPAPTSAPNRDSAIPAIFGLRRASKQEQAGGDLLQRRLNISGPYNFQHVAHTQKDHVSEMHSQLRTAQAPGASAEDMHFADFSSDSLPLADEERMDAPFDVQPTTTTLTRTQSVLKKNSSSRRLNRAMSQDQLRMGVPPPRPPRSPVEEVAAFFPPVPPPRASSARHERFYSETSTGFRAHQPLSMSPDAGSPPATSYGYVPGPEMDAIPEHSLSRVMSPPDDANWPLPCPSSTASEYTLPNVPEEDETAFVSKKSRASVASNSSLRGSQSVPMLRGFLLRQHDDEGRRSSQASDTLGRFDLFAAQRALKAALIESSRGDALPRETWEDAIDYCYDHAAEADCDYEWGRSSMDTSRDGGSATPVDEQERYMGSCEGSPAMLSPGQFDVPALSPVSQLSVTTAQEAITPITVNNPKTSNFSLPRIDSKNLLHVRKSSDASSFKESHGFTLSPSLLIPMDYQQQMMACEEDRHDVSDFAFRHFDETDLNVGPSTLHLRYRSSASTTATTESSNSVSEKHISAASTTSTDLTRMTSSASSLDFENYFPKPEPLQRFPSFESHGRVESKAAMPTLPESEEAVQLSSRRREFRSRGSESNLLKMAMDEPLPGKAKMSSIQARRGRARTTSLSTPPPPNQYALFPSVQLVGNRI